MNLGEALKGCAACGRTAGQDHASGCEVDAAARRRAHESYALHFGDSVVVLWANLEANGWRGAWSGFNRTSAELPYGGLEENRYRNADAALVAAFADVLPVIRVVRGKAQ
jgi:hypothetical protein